MIFVTVGTPQQPFTRLVKVMDEFASQTGEKIIIQAGTTPYEPRCAEHFRWAAFHEMEQLTRDARAVISQASAGAVILAFKYRKPVIVVPRLVKYGEHFNDHQYQLALSLSKSGQAVLVEDLSVSGIQQALDRALHQEVVHSSRGNLVSGLKCQLDTWQKQMKPKKNGQW